MLRAHPDHGYGPHFICIGPGGSATTWLADHLKLQRDVWMPPVQEASYLKTLMRKGTHGLDLDLHWDWWSIVKRLVRNRSLMPNRDLEFYREARALSVSDANEPDLDGYLRLFSPAHGKLTGDIAPVYASFSSDEIRDRLPALEGRKIFMIARHPVHRFWSALSRHAKYRTFGDVDYASLETAQRLFQDPERSLQHFPTQILDRWEAALGRDAVKVFYFDDVAQRPGETFARILDYIGSNYRYHLPVIPIGFNRKGRRQRVSPTSEARAWVQGAFNDELRRCAARFDPHGKRWLDSSGDGDDGREVASRSVRAAPG